MHIDWARVADEFEHVAPGWRDRGGITANEILQYAEVHNYTCIVWWQSRCIEKRQGEKRAICLSVEASHAYIYRGYRKLLEKIGPVRATRLKRQPKPRQEVTEMFTEIKEGCFYHHDLSELRVQLIQKGMPAQCSLTQPHDLKSPKDGAIQKTIKARSLWIKLLTTRIETGEPYLLFIDKVNEAIPNHQKLSGLQVKMSNLCSEITLPTGIDKDGNRIGRLK